MKLTNFQNLIIIITVGVLALANAALFLAVNNQISHTSDERVSAITLDLEDDIRDRIEIYSNLMYGVVGLFSASENVTPAEWQGYMDRIKVRERYPGIRSIVYAPIIDASQRSQFEATMRQSGQPDFTIHPATVTEKVAPALYIEPQVLDGVVRKGGFNIFSDSVRSRAIEFARDNNTLSITQKVTLVGDINGTEEPGFVLYLPIYKEDVPLDTIEQRRNAFTGIVTAGLRAKEFMNGVLSDYYKNLDFQLFDGKIGDLKVDNMLYNSGGPEVLQPGYTPKYSKLAEIDWPNNSWTVRYITSPKFGLTSFEMLLPYTMLLRNLILSAFLLYVIYRLMTKRNIKRRESNNSSKMLAENAMLDNADKGIIVTDSQGLILIFNRKAQQMLGYSEPQVLNKYNILNIISDDTLQVYSVKMAKELQEKVDPSFETIVTKSIIEGSDDQKWLVVTKSGMPLNLQVSLRPLYDDNNGLIGYQFKF